MAELKMYGTDVTSLGYVSESEDESEEEDIGKILSAGEDNVAQQVSLMLYLALGWKR